jgi:transcriptional regulator with XRE-family HTH domain
MAYGLSEGQKAAGREARRARRALKLLQAQVAGRAGVSTRTISDFENGRHWPRELSSISVAVGKSAEELEEFAVEYDRQRGGHRYPTQALAERIRELEENIARDGAELQRLRSNRPTQD